MPNWYLVESQNYKSIQTIQNRSWQCGFCSNRVSSDRGYAITNHMDGSGGQVDRSGIYICPNCRGVTSFYPIRGQMFPGTSYGHAVEHLPEVVGSVYEEARRCTGQNCHTAAVLLCRKLLMNIAVDQGADEGLKFIQYVNFLSDGGFVPPNGKHWVDHIRNKGNEATHEISVMEPEDAKDLLTFTEMLLKFIYEFPKMIQPPATDAV